MDDHRCYKCGFEGKLFAFAPAKKVKKSAMLCLSCAEISPIRSLPVALLAGIAFLVIGIILHQFFHFKADNLTLATGIFLLTVLPSVFIHELGHLIAAFLMGLKVQFLSIGQGQVVWGGKVAGLRVLLYSNPDRASVHLSDLNGALIRLRMIIFCSAGPLANIAVGLFFGLIAGTYLSGGQPSVVIRSMLFSIIILNLVLGLTNLIPRSVKTPYGIIYSDGKSILLWIFRGKSMLQRAKEMNHFAICYYHLLFQEWPQLVESADRGLQESPDSWQIKHLKSVALLEMGKPNEALELLEDLRNDTRLSELVEMFNKNNLAYAYFLRGDLKDLPTADTLSEQLVHDLPKLAPILGTRSCILLWKGHTQEAIAAFKKVLQSKLTKHTRVTNLYLLAIALAQCGEVVEADEVFATANKMNPLHFLASKAVGALQINSQSTINENIDSKITLQPEG